MDANGCSEIAECVKRNLLEKVPSFAWIEELLKDDHRLIQLACAHKAKVDKGPRCKFGTEVFGKKLKACNQPG
jgi:hypothetical protein